MKIDSKPTRINFKGNRYDMFSTKIIEAENKGTKII